MYGGTLCPALHSTQVCDSGPCPVNCDVRTFTQHSHMFCLTLIPNESFFRLDRGPYLDPVVRRAVTDLSFAVEK